MNNTEYLLVKLMEECAEVIQCCSKSLRFGLEEIAPGEEVLTNKDRLCLELTDVYAVMDMLDDKDIITGVDDGENVKRAKNRIKKYMEVSRKKGTLV